MRVTVIGECMAELAPAAREGTYRLGFAGDTFNTAWYLARCAPTAEVSFVTAVGDDALSGRMTAFMFDAGIDTRFVRTVPDRTIGLYMISLNDGERSFAYWRGQSAARTLADEPDALRLAMDGADVVFVSGITLAILCADRRAVLMNAMAHARTAGTRIAFDPNLRPKLWASADEMTGAIMRAAAVSDIVLPSFEDEAEWFGDADPLATLWRYLGAGAHTVIVKNGAGPVVYADGATQAETPVTPVGSVVDTTAAGDSFNAGVFAGMAVQAPLADAIAFACRLSGKVIQHRGALVSVDATMLSETIR